MSLEDISEDCSRWIYIATNTNNYTDMLETLCRYAGSNYDFSIVDYICSDNIWLTSETILDACYQNYYRSEVYEKE